jgi:flagellum-specific peptidoglycan hydrolase FlgJ
MEEVMKDLKDLKCYVTWNSICTWIVVFIMTIIIVVDSPSKKEHDNYDNHAISVYSSNLQDKYIRSKANLVDSINKYIITIAPTATLNGSEVLKGCEEYNIDICFALAQGQLESHFATKGVAAKTNSVWNVFSYDNLKADDIIKNGKGYKHPDYSIQPYMELLSEKYLIDGKTEMDLLDNFVNLNGERYASNPNYEKQLYGIYVKVNEVVNIEAAYQEYKKYKILTDV